MKIIDEKGRLFGKLNLIDLIAIVVIIAVVVFAAVKLLGGSSEGPSSVSGSGAHITYTVQVNSVDPEIYAGVQAAMEAAGGQDQLMASGELVDAFVTDVAAHPHVNYIATDSGEMAIVEESGPNARYDLIFTIEANVPDALTNAVGPQEVRVGKSHIVKTVHFEFTYGTVLSCVQG